jgi:copper homeostasis protein
MILVEACVGDTTSVMNAISSGADRMELCDNLAEGGTTPSRGMVLSALAATGLPVWPIVRCRGGDFVYTAAEQSIMLQDIALMRELGCPGVVIGAVTAAGRIDEVFVSAAREAAGSMPLAFHRAFDACRDPMAALEALISLDVRRVLTSGGHETAWAGRQRLAELVSRAGDRIAVMPGGGIVAEHVRELVTATGAREIHLRATDARRFAAVVAELRGM